MFNRIAQRYLEAAIVTLDLDWVEKLRKDFLTLMKNTPRVKDYKTAHQLRDALRVYRAQFDDLFFNRFLNNDLKYEYEKYGLDEGYAKYYDKKLRSPAWSFSSELGNIPIGFSDNYHTEEARFVRYEQEYPKWASRVKTKAQAFWKEMKDVLQDFRNRERTLTVKTKDKEQVVLEGFRVLVVDFDESDKIDVESLDIFKEGLRIYKRNAATRFPRLLKEQLPLIFECEATLGKAGTYNHNGTITFYATGMINETPSRAAHVLAHEMGHHMWRLIGNQANEFWSVAINRDYGDIDIEELLEKWPQDLWAYEFVKYMSDKDPVLAIQVDTVSHEGVSRDLDKREDFQRLLDNGQKTLKVPKTPISGYAGKNTEEAFCEAVGLLVAYGPRALHERVRFWLSIILEGDVKMARVASGELWPAAAKDLAKFNTIYQKAKKKPDEIPSLLPGVTKLKGLRSWVGLCLDADSSNAVFDAWDRVKQGDPTSIESLQGALKKAVSNLSPAQFEYAGFKVYNPDRMSDDVCLGLLDAVDYLEALFKKRGVSKMLQKGISHINLAPMTKIGGPSGFYAPATRSITLFTSLVEPAGMNTFIKWTHHLFLHEFGHYVHTAFLPGEAVAAWDAPWEDTSEAPETYPLSVSTYGKKDKYEDFAETFVAFMAAPEKLTPEANFRMQRALSLAGLYGKQVMRMASLAERIAARFKKKVETDKGNIVYVYSERQVALRNKKKAERIAKLEKALSKIRSTVKQDLRSDDPEKKLTALAVALMDHTFERVGNDESAEERGHFGVTGWQRGHISFSKGKATVSYTGKSGVKQKKIISDATILKALRDAYDGVKGDDACIFSWENGRVTAEKVNAYLKPFDVTAKDIRGFHANSEMKKRLQEARKEGGSLPTDKKKAQAQLKEEFKSVLSEVAKAVGHEPKTLASQYLVPNLEETYLKDGTVLDRFSSM